MTNGAGTFCLTEEDKRSFNVQEIKCLPSTCELTGSDKRRMKIEVKRCVRERLLN